MIRLSFFSVWALVAHIKSVGGQVFTCSTVEQCSNHTIEDVVVELDAYKAAFGDDTRLISETNLFARGAFSAHSASYLEATSLRCLGLQSCSFAKNATLPSAGLINCLGGASCVNTKLVVPKSYSSKVICYPAQSCQSSQTTAREVHGKGSYSLKNAVIESDPGIGSNMYFYMTGYNSGFNLTINCLDSSVTCHIYCYGNGCHMTFLNCPYDNCNVIGCDESQGIDCPHTIANVSEISNKYSLFEYMWPCDWPDLNSLSVSNDFICNNPSFSQPSLAFDTDGTLSTALTTNATICCRGDASCQGGNILTVTGANNVVCGGESSCLNRVFEFMHAESSALSTFPILHCGGATSCKSAKVNANSGSGGIVICSGYQSCLHVTIHSADAVFCAGGGSCQNTALYAVENVFIQSDENTNLNVFSNGVGVTNIAFMSYAASDSVGVLCDSGDKCIIYCLTNGACTSFSSLVCDGACTIGCDQNNGIECPNMTALAGPDSSQTNSTGTYEFFNVTLFLRNLSQNSFDSPTDFPSILPSNVPSSVPSSEPSSVPSSVPSSEPSNVPSSVPSGLPTMLPTSFVSTFGSISTQISDSNLDTYTTSIASDLSTFTSNTTSLDGNEEEIVMTSSGLININNTDTVSNVVGNGKKPNNTNVVVILIIFGAVAASCIIGGLIGCFVNNLRREKAEVSAEQEEMRIRANALGSGIAMEFSSVPKTSLGTKTSYLSPERVNDAKLLGARAEGEENPETGTLTKGGDHDTFTDNESDLGDSAHSDHLYTEGNQTGATGHQEKPVKDVKPSKKTTLTGRASEMEMSQMLTPQQPTMGSNNYSSHL